MSNRKRNIQILFCVTPEEKKLIRQKMILSKTRNMGAYLRKMAIDGYIINTDTTPIKQMYEEMHKIADIDNSIIATEQRISELSSEISHQELIQKHCSSYRTCRKIVEDAKTAPNPQKYKAAHQSEYKLHDTLKQRLQELGITKLPSPERLQKKIDNLRNERSSATKEKQDLEKRRSTLNTITANFNTLLSNNAHFKDTSEHRQEEHDL